MENIEIKNEKVKSLTHTEKFKIFAMVSVHKDLVAEIDRIPERLVLCQVGAYSVGDAMFALINAIQGSGKNPDDFILAKQLIMQNLDELVDLPALAKSINPLNFPPEIIEETPKEKSNTDMIAYVRFIFDMVGTDDEKKMANVVIKKFEEYAKSVFEKKQ